MKNKYHITASFSFILFSLFFMRLNAQTNLALTATMTTNVLGNALYPITNMNDNVIVACGSWTTNGTWFSASNATTGEYMDWTWTSPKSINKMIIYYGEINNRYMDAATVEYWNGSTWVTHYSFSGLNMATCVQTINFNSVTTTAIRLTNWNIVGTQASNPDFREIEMFGPAVNNDAAVSFITSPDLCTYTQAISARIANQGKKKLDSFRLYWSVNNVLQSVSYVKSNILSTKDTTIILKASFTFTQSTSYTFRAWTSLPNGQTDSVPANDLFTLIVDFLGNPSPPSTTNFIQCGVGKPLLQATPANAGDSILWYTASAGGTLLGIGRTLVGPHITATTTYYAQALKFGGSYAMGPGFNGAVPVTNNLTVYNGAMFDINVFKSIVLDSVTFSLTTANPTTNYRIYYKTGTHQGFETNASAWTLINSGQVRYFTTGGKYYARVSAKNLFLQGSQLYGFYYTTDPTTGGGNDILNLGGIITTTNTDLSVSGRLCMQGLFGSVGVYTPYTGNLQLMLKQQCANPTRTALVVTVKPRPTGADIVKGSPFQGQFRIGDVTTPDITEAGKTIVYQIVPPTGFNNSGHGSTWTINNISARTRYGVLVPSSEYTVVDPSGSGPGTVTFIPKSKYLDSFITFSINYSDLGPYYCDSTIKRTVVVAPTPRPNFKVPTSICLGDNILFDNLTTISSGNASYTWYFGNGDTSDNQSPVYEYKAPGVYAVKLVAKSYPWNVLHDTTITVEVGELPVTKYKVNNKCQGLPVTFQNQTVVGNGTLTYDWDFGDGSAHSTATNPSHLYGVPGGYKVTLKANANGCISTLIKNAYMFARPVANFAAPLAPVCAKTEVVLPNTSTILLGSQGAYWSFGDGTGSTQFHGLNTYINPGTYLVKLLAVSEFDCKDSITKSVIIKPTPTPDFAGNQFCGMIPTIFTNKTVEDLSNPAYKWTFSDNFTSTQKNVTRSWPHEGPYSATLKATYSNGCTGSVTKDFDVLLQPKADFTVFDICSGGNAEFVNLSVGDRGNIHYFWDFGNGTNTTTHAPIRLYNPATTTTYTVTLVASYTAGCSDTLRKTITVSESPVCDFTFKDMGLGNVQFTPGNTTYAKYEWFFGEGGTSKSTNPKYLYKYTGNFDVTMHATNLAGCSCQITKRASATTGISSLANTSGVSVYPNPNNGTFTVANADNHGMKVEVFNVLGSRIYSKTSADGSLLVNLEDHAKGIYLVKVTVNGVTTTSKITVTN